MYIKLNNKYYLVGSFELFHIKSIYVFIYLKYPKINQLRKINGNSKTEVRHQQDFYISSPWASIVNPPRMLAKILQITFSVLLHNTTQKTKTK